MKYLLAFIIVSFSFQANAQSEAELKEIAGSVCECIQGKLPSLNGAKEVEMALGVCMLDLIQAKGLKVDISDGAQMEAFGQKIGIQMAGICPSVFTSLIGDDTPTKPEESSFDVTGTVKAVETTDIATIVLRDNTGKEHRMLWITYFNGSDDFVAAPSKLVGKTITITYTLVDVYMPKQKAYVTSKLVSKITVN